MTAAIPVIIVCSVLAAEIYFVIRQFAALREILRRSTYSCRTRGSVIASKKCSKRGGADTYRYTVRFLADEQEYTFRFERTETDGPVSTGKRIVVIYPEGKPSAAYAQLETDCFRQQCMMTAAHIVLLGLTAFGSGAVSELFPQNLRTPALQGSLILWVAACLLFAAFIVWERICMRTQSAHTTGTVVRPFSTSYRGTVTRYQTVRYTVSNQTYTFTQAQSGRSAKSCLPGSRIPVRYLKKAPFAAECADRAEWLRWWCVFFALFFPALMLFRYLTG